MVFSSVNNPLYLDPQNWHQQQQQNYDQASSGSRGENPHPPALPPPAAQPGGSSGIRPGSMADRARLAKIPQPETGLKCPRCESTNTKFCYFNNYNLSQPRHFCKTCRRYWTRGGALRNVPVGGGCRRNKRTRSRTSKSPAAAVAAGSIVNISAPSSVTTISSAATEHQLMTNHFPQLPLFGSLHHYGLNHYEGIGGASAESVNLGFQMGGAAPHHFPPFLTSFDNNSSSSLFPLQLRSMETTQPAAASSVKEERNQEEVMNLISKPFTFLGISETTNNNTATTNNNNNHYWPAGENGWTDFGDLN